MTPLLGAQAAVLYLLPVIFVAVLLLLRTSSAELARGASPHGALTRLAMSVPIVLGADVLAVLLLGFCVPLGTSVVIVRVLWTFGAVAYGVRHRRGLSLAPMRVALLPLALAALAGALGTLPFCETSFTLNAWDREWHIPLVASLEGQRLPFSNVFEPARLRYHYLGDVIAAALRVLSGNVASAAAALSLAHDLFFFLTGAWLALLSFGLGRRRWLFGVFAGASILLHGPGQRALAGDYDGFAFHPFSRLSYRPHVPISLFALVAFSGSLAVLAARAPTPDPQPIGTPLQRLRAMAWPPRVALLASMMLLAMSDETSAAVLGAAMAFVWLANPRVLAERRLAAFGFLIALALALIVPNFVFTATLAPGGPVQSSTWSAPRLVSLGGTVLPLARAEAKWVLLQVLAPVVAAILALVFAVPSVRSRGRLAMLVFPCAVLLVCLILGTVLTVNGVGPESQRFFVAPFLAALVPAILTVPSAKGSTGRPLALGLTVLTLAIPATYTLLFLPWQLRTARGVGISGEMGTPSNKMYPRDLYAANCRRDAGARTFDAAEDVYVDESGFMSWAGCRASRVAGTTTTVWPVRIYPVVGGKGQLPQLLANVQGDSFSAICNRNGASDAFCTELTTSRACAAEGRWFVRCEFRRDEAREFLSRP